MLRKSVATSGFTPQSYIHRKCAIYCVTFLLWLFVLILDTELHFCFETASSPQKLPTKVAKSDPSPFQPFSKICEPLILGPFWSLSLRVTIFGGTSMV